jgi:hypothetical protein
LNKVKYLPLLDNEVRHENNEKWKNNFLKIKNLILMASPHDRIIRPWQSSIFGFHNENETRILDMRERDIYKLDTFGLKTLHNSNRLKIHVVQNIHHSQFIHNKKFFIDHILQYLN